MPFEQIVDPTFPQGDIQRSQVKSLFVSKSSVTFNYRNGIITMTWSAECNATDSWMEDSAAEESCRTMVKEGFKMMLLDGHHHCSAVCVPNTEDRQEWI